MGYPGQRSLGPNIRIDEPPTGSHTCSFDGTGCLMILHEVVKSVVRVSSLESFKIAETVAVLGFRVQC